MQKIIKRNQLLRWKYPERHRARDAVYKAIMSCKLIIPQVLNCADCSNQAEEYDHYKGHARENRLKVQPVCRPCHVIRTMNDNRKKEE